MKIVFISLFFLSALAVSAQDIAADSILKHGKIFTKNYIGVKFGVVNSSFTRNNSISAPGLGDNSKLSWHAGVAADFFTTKNYNARVELSYTSKGAKETFSNDRVAIESLNRLNYVQLTALPLIVKPGFNKINPYLALGGYYARRVGIKSKSRTGQAGWEPDDVTAANLDVKNDYGYSVSVGIYVWKRPLFELRYEAGLPSVSSYTKIKNRSVILSFSI